VATISSLVDRVRAELGDTGKSFVNQFVADGTTNRFRLPYSPLDATTVHVYKNAVEITNASSIEESSGVLICETVPADGDEMSVNGTFFRYFTGAELEQIVETAIIQHSAKHTDTLGRTITAATLPVMEEYPVVVYATSLALYTLATDASFDIDIQAPDGVTIPRAQRYRQLMEMVQTRKNQYQELCVHLGIGLFSIDVFSFRRISKATGRLIPVYQPQEVDDRSWPQRAALAVPTYGDKPSEWPTQGKELTAYQDVPFVASVDFTGDFTGKSFVAYVLNQRGSVVVAQNFALTVDDNGDGAYTATMSLSRAQTVRLAKRTHWSLQSVDDVTGEKAEILGADLFTVREREVIV
jgi:hypothetical protein